MANLKTALKNMAWKRNKSNNARDSSDNILRFLYTTEIEENTTNEILFYLKSGGTNRPINKMWLGWL